MLQLLTAACCIAAAGSALSTPPLQAQLWPCDAGSALQQWTLPPAGQPGLLALAAAPAAPPRVLDLQGQGFAQLVDQPTPPLPSQQWLLRGGALVHNATAACLAASVPAAGSPSARRACRAGRTCREPGAPAAP